MKEPDKYKELIEWIEIMHLQNTNGRETGREMFRLGIEAAIEELIDFDCASDPKNGGIKRCDVQCKGCSYIKDD